MERNRRDHIYILQRLVGLPPETEENITTLLDDVTEIQSDISVLEALTAKMPYGLKTSTTAVPVENTASETVVATVEVPSLLAGWRAVFSGRGSYLNNTGSARTVTFRQYYDNSSTAAATSISLNSSATRRIANLTGVLAAVTNSSQYGAVSIPFGGVSDAEGTGAVDATVSRTLEYRVQHSSNDASFILREYAIVLFPPVA